MSKKVLLVGESWLMYTTHVKGFDSFYTSTYASGETYLKDALEEGGYEVTYMPSHEAAEGFPFLIEELKAYDCIILTDIGANTLLLPIQTFSKSIKMPNRCNLLRDYVLEGGSLFMIGGYLTFAGIDAKGKWHDTATQDVLPVEVLTVDDRMEHCEGIKPITLQEDHEIFEGVDPNWPDILGYNKTILKEGTELLAEVEGNPFIVTGEYGDGRSAVFTTDCAPHWAPPEFVEWESYGRLFCNMIKWLTRA